MRFIVGLLLIAHGAAHAMGFAIPWRLGPGKDVPSEPTILNGTVNLGDAGMRVLGIAWLVAALFVVVAGLGVIAGSPWGGFVTLDATMFSLVLCILGWPQSRTGIIINVAILAYIGFGGPLR